MTKKIVFWVIGILLLSGLATGVYFYMTNDQTTKPEETETKEQSNEPEKETTEDEEQEVEELSEEKFEDSTNEEGLNPFGDDKEKNEISELTVRDYIHQMSHQKVEADKKWGFYRITDDRIQWLLEVVETNDYSDSSQYEEILHAWEEGDFSNVDDHHNTIWKMQGGNVGRATGVLSPEEEQEYIESAE